MTTRTFTVCYVCAGDGWVMFVEELSAAVTQGKTIKEARANAHEALVLLLDVRRELMDEETAGHEVVREEFTVTLP